MRLTSEEIANRLNALLVGVTAVFIPRNTLDFSRVLGAIDMYQHMRHWHFEYMRFTVTINQTSIHVKRNDDVHKS